MASQRYVISGFELDRRVVSHIDTDPDVTDVFDEVDGFTVHMTSLNRRSDVEKRLGKSIAHRAQIGENDIVFETRDPRRLIRTICLRPGVKALKPALVHPVR